MVVRSVSSSGPGGGGGEPGADGKSAYQIWLDAGNVGTIEQFLASLIGPPGADGADGEPGAPGGGAALTHHWLASATASVALTNQPNSEQSLANTPANSRKFLLLSGMTEARITGYLSTGSASVNNPRLYAKYATSYGGSYSLLAETGEQAVSLASIGAFDSGWFPIAAGAKGDVFIDMRTNGGDGVADPSLTNLALHLR